MTPLSRREFLGWLGVGVVGAAAAGCNPAPGPSSNTPTSVIPTLSLTKTPTAVPTPSGLVVEILGGSRDVFAWETRVSGRLSQPERCTALVVRAGGQEIAAEVEGDRFSTLIPVQPGTNQVAVICTDQTGIEEISNMVNVTGRLRNVPTARIIAGTDQHNVFLDGGKSTPAEPVQANDTGSKIVRHTWVPRTVNPTPAQLVGLPGMPDQEFTYPVSAVSIELRLPEVDGEYYFTLEVVDEAGRSDRSTTYIVVKNGIPELPDLMKDNAAWVESAVVYGVIPRNFGSDGFLSIIQRLDNLKDLGITALWLAPVNLSPAGDYGYAVMDYFELNPRYGTKEEFHRLVQEAHARGIRVCMDFVPNHSSVEHPYFQDTLLHGKDSHYWDFYDRVESGQPTHYFDWTHLPNLNFSNPEVERWMTEAFSYWVREFDVDGFRVDAAWGIRLRKPDYWPRWRQEMSRIKPDLMLLAEAGARDPYYFDSGWDAAYDWTDQLGHWAWENVFEGEPLIIYNLDHALRNGSEGFHPDALIFRFLNNNDTGTRFITKYGPERTLTATALLLTLPGVPCIYTGDEVGEAFRPYFDPQPLTWKETVTGLRDYHKKLIQLRRTIPSLHSRHWSILNLEPHTEVYGYLRYEESGAYPVMVLINFYTEDAQVEVSLPELYGNFGRAGSLIDLLGDRQVPVRYGETLQVSVPGHTALILSEQDFS